METMWCLVDRYCGKGLWPNAVLAIVNLDVYRTRINYNASQLVAPGMIVTFSLSGAYRRSGDTVLMCKLLATADLMKSDVLTNDFHLQMAGKNRESRI